MLAKPVSEDGIQVARNEIVQHLLLPGVQLDGRHTGHVGLEPVRGHRGARDADGRAGGICGVELGPLTCHEADDVAVVPVP